MTINYREINKVAPDIPRAAFLTGAGKGKQRTYHTIAALIWANAAHGDGTHFSARDIERALGVAHVTSRNATLWNEAAGFFVRTGEHHKPWALTEQGKDVYEQAKELFGVMYDRTAKRYLRMSELVSALAVAGAPIEGGR